MFDVAVDLASTEMAPPEAEKICLNMVIGDVREPYLAASLDAAYVACDWAVINVNGSEALESTEKNLKDVRDSAFYKEGNLTLVCSPFRNYAFNRNLCLEISRRCGWILRIDADEVLLHPASIRLIVQEAEKAKASRVFGHYWHFLKGWQAVQNKNETDPTYHVAFLFKMYSDLYWSGVTHERIAGPGHSDLVLDYAVWDHFGYVNPMRVFDKWLRFSHLEGDPNHYVGYFNDPKAPWRTSPSTILDDRPQFPQATTSLKEWKLDSFHRVHREECTADEQGRKCVCQHDPPESGDPRPE